MTDATTPGADRRQAILDANYRNAQRIHAKALALAQPEDRPIIMAVLDMDDEVARQAAELFSEGMGVRDQAHAELLLAEGPMTAAIVALTPDLASSAFSDLTRSSVRAFEIFAAPPAQYIGWIPVVVVAAGGNYYGSIPAGNETEGRSSRVVRRTEPGGGG